MKHHELEILDGPAAGKKFRLKTGLNTIGRGTRCTISLPGYERLSRVHANITMDDRGVNIEDANSTNGLKVNNHAVQKSALHDGSSIKLGNCLMRYQTTDRYVAPGLSCFVVPLP